MNKFKKPTLINRAKTGFYIICSNYSLFNKKPVKMLDALSLAIVPIIALLLPTIASIFAWLIGMVKLKALMTVLVSVSGFSIFTIWHSYMSLRNSGGGCGSETD